MLEITGGSSGDSRGLGLSLTPLLRPNLQLQLDLADPTYITSEFGLCTAHMHKSSEANASYSMGSNMALGRSFLHSINIYYGQVLF